MIGTDVNHAASRAWIEHYLDGRGPIMEPTLLLAEVAGAISRRTGSAVLGRQALTDLLRLRPLRLLPLDAALARSAAQLAADLHLHGSDAIYVATAQRLSVPLVTWDREQRERTTPVIVTRTPDQMN